ncbi:MAG: hypothetical protein QW568_01520 [Candidatus Anstonellaceae archaeon]
MGADKFPKFSEIPWDKIDELRVSGNKKNFSFEFDLEGRRQKMTMSVAPNSTTFTLSTMDGSPIVSATQRGKEIKVLDFSAKVSKLPKWVKGLQKKSG